MINKNLSEKDLLKFYRENPEKLNDLITYWHDKEIGDEPLNEFLGLSWDAYSENILGKFKIKGVSKNN